MWSGRAAEGRPQDVRAGIRGHGADAHARGARPGPATSCRPAAHIRERVQGPEHSGTLAIRHELGYWTRQAGNGLNPAASRDSRDERRMVHEQATDHPSSEQARQDTMG